MSESTKPTASADDSLAFGWWTYGLLLIYSAFLLGIFGFVAMHLADASRSFPTSADQRQLPFAICTLSDLGSTGSPARSLCPHLLN
jgi:hypothetical protein